MKTVILAAGFGSRLWPLSTSEKPKQFQKLIQGESPLKYTYAKLAEVIPIGEIYVLALEGMQQLVFDELPEMEASHIIIVPERRNTLPHTLWVLNAISNDPDEPVLFKSVDHFIVNQDEFNASLKVSMSWYSSVSPAFTLLCTRFESFDENNGYCLVDKTGEIIKFLEKPNKQAVEELAKTGDVYCSPMIFITSKSAASNVLQKIDEDWAKQANDLLLADESSRQQAFLEMPSLDISNTVFQKSKELVVHEINYEYVDVGRFQAIYDLNQKDSEGNVVIGNVILNGECSNNLVINEIPSPLVIISSSSCVIIQTQDGSLISPFSDVDAVGDVYKSQIHLR